MEYKLDLSLLGKGPAFPFNVSPTGGTSYSEGIDRINHRLFMLFETYKGSRLMMPEYGSDIHKYKFDPLDKVLMERLRYTISEDIRKWEPGISLTNIEFLKDSQSIDSNTLYISINYNIINTEVRGNYVYPYELSTYDTLESSYR